MQLTFEAIQKSFRLSERLSPRLAGRLAAHLFHVPPPVATLGPRQERLARQADAILEIAERRERIFARRKVVTYHLPAAGPSRGEVVLVHGWTGRARFMVAFALELMAAGFATILLDLPAHGEAAGRTTDVRDCADVLKDLLRETGPVAGLVGHSFAGGVISLALNDPDMRELTTDARVALVSSPNRYAYVTDLFARAVGLSPEAQEVFEALTCARIGMPMEKAVGHRLMLEAKVPLLLVHCRDDVEVAFREAEIWHDSYPQATLHQVRGLGHRDIVTAPVVTTRVAGFISGGAGRIQKSA